MSFEMAPKPPLAGISARVAGTIYTTASEHIAKLLQLGKSVLHHVNILDDGRRQDEGVTPGCLHAVHDALSSQRPVTVAKG